jgi:hypothetical protein
MSSSNQFLLIISTKKLIKKLSLEYGFFSYQKGLFIKRIPGKFLIHGLKKRIRLIDETAIVLNVSYKNITSNPNLKTFVNQYQIDSSYVIL